MTARPILHRQHVPNSWARYNRDTLTAEQADNIRRERERGWHLFCKWFSIIGTAVAVALMMAHVRGMGL